MAAVMWAGKQIGVSVLGEPLYAAPSQQERNERYEDYLNRFREEDVSVIPRWSEPVITRAEHDNWNELLQRNDIQQLMKALKEAEDRSMNPTGANPWNVGASAQVEKELDKALLAREVARQLEAYDALGEDTYPELTILKFTLRYQDTDKDYTFGALKVDKAGKSHWHLTDGATYTWDQLKRLLAKADPTPVLNIMVEVSTPKPTA